MKKILTISLVDNNYKIQADDGKTLVVKSEDLILNGKDLYDSFFSNVTFKEKLDLTIKTNESIKGSREQHICNDLKTILDDICKRINDEVEKRTQPEATVSD